MLFYYFIFIFLFYYFIKFYLKSLQKEKYKNFIKLNKTKLYKNYKKYSWLKNYNWKTKKSRIKRETLFDYWKQTECNKYLVWQICFYGQAG